MKRSLLFLSALIIAGSFTSCKKYDNKEVYANVPVYMDYDAFRTSFYYEAEAVPVEHPGNIYIHNQYIFVVDEDKGIHILDNHDKTNPYFLGFMNIPGATQVSVDGTTLYANSFIDLVTIDISNINDPKMINRDEDVFTYSTPISNDEYPIADIYKDRGVVVDWNIEMTKDVSGFGAKWFVSDCEECEQTEMQTKSSASVRVNLAGSRSKMAIINNHLYVLDQDELKSFNISNQTDPVFAQSQNTWSDPETLFPDGEFLYVGTTTGMKIFDAGANPERPNETGEVEHVESCDPVVVQGDYAYVTLRSGSECGGVENELQVIDVSKKWWPKLKRQYDMSDPHGLAVEGDLLFICDGNSGLKVYDNSDPLDCGDNLLYNFPAIQTSDLILNNGTAIMIAEEGVYQYDYTNPSNLHMISLLYF
ncbi:MAG: hypothetical protein BM555_00725 [Crocinitomix sp. MedPE-SWsnd]|nr:MAG: hypothetical protein BM555_00725 [Crocinitomix sp. MedPE-SWsnd]